MTLLTGNLLMKVLIGQYLCVAMAFAVEGNWPKAAYFLSAAAISLSVLCM